jgi:hypothetical protein
LALGDKMDTIYFRDAYSPSQMFYEDGATEGINGERSNAGLPLLNLVDPKTHARAERRNHNRFQIKKVAFAMIRSAFSKPICLIDRSLGEIACDVFRSKPIKLGRINDISMDGLLFRYVDSKIQSIESPVLDILLADCGFYLESVSFNTISDTEIAEDYPIDSVKMKQLRMQFRKLTPNQKYKLEYLIQNHGSEF